MPSSREAADVLVQHLFASAKRSVPGIEYAADYRLAIGRSGGDIVDVFPLSDGSVSLVVADIAGKGPQASVQAALVKYALRAYASAALSPAESLERLDTLYGETTRFEESNSFVTVFAGRLTADRRTLRYASAGHEVVALKQPEASAALLDVTGGAVGVLPIFTIGERVREIEAGALLVLATDGVSESRSGNRFFGTDGFLDAIDRHASEPAADVSRRIGEAALAFADGVARDDCAVLAIRCLA